jgi:hypothetical protein
VVVIAKLLLCNSFNNDLRTDTTLVTGRYYTVGLAASAAARQSDTWTQRLNATTSLDDMLELQCEPWATPPVAEALGEVWNAFVGTPDDAAQAVPCVIEVRGEMYCDVMCCVVLCFGVVLCFVLVVCVEVGLGVAYVDAGRKCCHPQS